MHAPTHPATTPGARQPGDLAGCWPIAAWYPGSSPWQAVEVMRRVAESRRFAFSQLPTADLVTQEGDVVYMTVGTDQIADLDAHLGGPASPGGH